ncbi:hypothetical protein PG997_013684 [Apiospora hydei]|uniref:Uncharacterized protein n=1 Tax=Apiospora hydei TaxID=1337664 RepID=A0ABR1V7M0_9PEZI
MKSRDEHQKLTLALAPLTQPGYGTTCWSPHGGRPAKIKSTRLFVCSPRRGGPRFADAAVRDFRHDKSAFSDQDPYRRVLQGTLVRHHHDALGGQVTDSSGNRAA